MSTAQNPTSRALAWVLLLVCIAGDASSASDERVVIESDGWQLVGEWRAPDSETPVPAALLLHRAAGSREEYADLAAALESRGVASLRLDLRAHGESGTLGRFAEPYAENRPLLEGTERDVNAALSWMKARPGVTGDRIAVVGASYTGEAIGEALRAGGDGAAAYVLLSPGSFSDESIAAVDLSGGSWLFIRTSEEGEVSLPFIDAVFDELTAKSRSAEVRVVPGTGHATRIFDEHPFMIAEVADWLAKRLARFDVVRADVGVEAARRPASAEVRSEVLLSDLAADYEAAVDAYVGRDYASALEAFRGLAELDHPGAWFHLGLIHQQGQGVVADPVEAARWYRLAAERDHSSAQLSLALLYHQGHGVPRDDALAVQWCRRAAESGLAGAQVTLALMYQEGEGLPQDHAQAAGWFRKAAEQGHSGAQLSLAVLYLQGQGVAEDAVEAAVWCRRAAEQGDAAAQFMLAFMYQQGRGVPQDNLTAHVWAGLAAASRDDPAAKELQRALEAAMSPEEIAEARRRAGEWKPD